MTTLKENSIWRLSICANKYLSLIPHDITYFNTYFMGRAMPLDWVAPPVVISGSTKKLPDFVGWMTGAPVVSEKAKLALFPCLDGFVQFLPFHDIKGKKYFAMNVTHVETSLLDIGKSEVLYSSSVPKVALTLKRAFFNQQPQTKLPPIFKVTILSDEDVDSEIFVTKSFAEIAIKCKLSGIALADPEQDSFKAVLANKNQNIVPGIVG